MLVGAIGGAYAIIWAAFGWCMADFESFKKTSGIISDFYSTENPKS